MLVSNLILLFINIYLLWMVNKGLKIVFYGFIQLHICIFAKVL